MMTLTKPPGQNPYKLDHWVRWVLRWLIRPILALNDRPHVGQTREESINADVDELAALDLRNSHFFLAPAVLLSSSIWYPVWVKLRQVGRSTASLFHVSMLMSNDLGEALRVSLKRFFCPPTERLPSASSPQSSSLGMHCSGIRYYIYWISSVLSLSHESCILRSLLWTHVRTQRCLLQRYWYCE